MPLGPYALACAMLSMGIGSPPQCYVGINGGTHIPGEFGRLHWLRSHHRSCIPRCREICENAIWVARARPCPTVFHTNSFLCGLASKKEISGFILAVRLAAGMFGRSEQIEYSLAVCSSYLRECSKGGTTVPFWLTVPNISPTGDTFSPTLPTLESGINGGTHIPGEFGRLHWLRSHHRSCIPRCREICGHAIWVARARPCPTVFHTNSFLCGLASKKEISGFILAVRLAAGMFGRSEQIEYSCIYRLFGSFREQWTRRFHYFVAVINVPFSPHPAEQSKGLWRDVSKHFCFHQYMDSFTTLNQMKNVWKSTCFCVTLRRRWQDVLLLIQMEKDLQPDFLIFCKGLRLDSW